MGATIPAEPADGVATVAGKLRRTIRLFASVGDHGRARRASDLILLILSVVGIVFVGLIAIPEPGFSQSVSGFLRRLPDALIGLWQVLADVVLVWAVVLLVATFVRRRVKIGRDMLLAIVVGIAWWMVLARIVDGAWPLWPPVFSDVQGPPVFPSARLAIPAAMIVTASPHLVRPARRLGYLVIALGAAATVTLGASSTIGVAASLLSAGAAAAIVHLIVGSSAGRPSLEIVRAALVDMNVAVTELGAAHRQSAGNFAVDAIGVDGSSLIVKLYGRDAHDAALVSTIWRAIWFRRAGTPVGFGRLRQVEHEALLTLLAAQAGIATDAVVTAGATAGDDAILVLRRTGSPIRGVVLTGVDRLDEVGPDPLFVGDEAASRIQELWQLVARLHRNGIAHGQLDEEHILVDDGRLGLADFRGASVAPTVAQLRSDTVQMFVTTIGLVGTDAAISHLGAHLSGDEIEGFLPYLQSVALTANQRRMIKGLGIDLDDLRARVAQTSEVEPPELVKLRRFSIGSVARVALPVLAGWFLISSLAGFDLAEFADTVQEAAFWLVVIGFVVAQLPRVAQAVSTLGAAPIPLPLGPVYALQLAISYVNLAIPTAAARIAVNIRFFQRQGVPPSAAVATGALDGVSGFIVQAMLLGSLLLFSSLSLDVAINAPSSAAIRAAWIIGGCLVAAIVVIVAVPRLRAYVLGGVRHVAAEAIGVLRNLRSLRRVVMLFGGNLMAELLFALALGVFVQAFGYSLAFHELLFINMSVSLLAGLLPVPGGIGVTEGGLILGLTSFDVPQEVAFAAVILYRLSTFYLPPVWGFFSLRWLERNRYL